MYKNSNIKINNTDRDKGDCNYTMHKSQHSVRHLLVLEDGAGQKPKQSQWLDFHTVNCCVPSSHPLPGMLCPARQESCLRGMVHLPVAPLQPWVLMSQPCPCLLGWSEAQLVCTVLGQWPHGSAGHVNLRIWTWGPSVWQLTHRSCWLARIV